MKPIEITESEYLSKSEAGIFYHKTEANFYCKIVMLNGEIIRNIWRNEKLAFEWMNKFKEDFD